MPEIDRRQLAAYAALAVLVLVARRAAICTPSRGSRPRPRGRVARVRRRGGSLDRRRRRRRARSSTSPARCAIPASTGSAGERVEDAVAPAGGATRQGRPQRDQPRGEGGRRRSRSSCPRAAWRPRPPAPGRRSAGARRPRRRSNLNTATAEQLDTLDGVGPGDGREDPRLAPGARRLPQRRRPRAGPGIGPKKLAALEPQVRAVRPRPRPRWRGRPLRARRRARRSVRAGRSRRWRAGARPRRWPRVAAGRCAPLLARCVVLAGRAPARATPASPRSTRTALGPLIGHALRGARDAAGGAARAARSACGSRSWRSRGRARARCGAARRPLAARGGRRRSCAVRGGLRAAARARVELCRAAAVHAELRAWAGARRRARGAAGRPARSTRSGSARDGALARGPAAAAGGAAARDGPRGGRARCPTGVRDDLQAHRARRTLVAASGANVLLLAALALASARRWASPLRARLVLVARADRALRPARRRRAVDPARRGHGRGRHGRGARGAPGRPLARAAARGRRDARAATARARATRAGS